MASIVIFCFLLLPVVSHRNSQGFSNPNQCLFVADQTVKTITHVSKVYLSAVDYSADNLSSSHFVLPNRM